MCILTKFVTKSVFIESLGESRPVYNVHAMIEALGIKNTKWKYRGSTSIVEGTFNPESFDKEDCIKLLEFIYCGSSGSNAKIKGDQFVVRLWHE